MSRTVPAAAALALGAMLPVGCMNESAGQSRTTPAPRQVVQARPPVPRRPSPSARPSRAEQDRALRRLVRLGYPVYCGGRRGHLVALTFDDGPGPYTPDALRMLGKAHARATFFLVGKELHWFPGWARKETKLAALGDHTWTHPWLPGRSAPVVRSELARTKQAVIQSSGVEVRLFRPPYGGRSPVASAAARKLGLVEVLWSRDSADSAGAVPRQILANVTAGLRPGAIILMHENRGQTIKALGAILRRVKKRHLRAVTVPELLAADPPSVAQLRSGYAGCRARR